MDKSRRNYGHKTGLFLLFTSQHSSAACSTCICVSWYVGLGLRCGLACRNTCKIGQIRGIASSGIKRLCDIHPIQDCPDSKQYTDQQWLHGRFNIAQCKHRSRICTNYSRFGTKSGKMKYLVITLGTVASEGSQLNRSYITDIIIIFISEKENLIFFYLYFTYWMLTSP